MAYVNLKRYPEAIEAHKQAIRLDPKLARSYFNLGLAYHFAGCSEEAMQQHKILQTLDPELAKQFLERISK
jgi:tetratricopeptide (TPR) repeat protein